MAVKIRLKRMGKIRQPYYRVVVVDSRKKRDGKVIEEIGKYHPKDEPSFIEVQSERAQYWLGVGAQPTEAVEAILKVTGDWQQFKGLPGAEGTLKVKEAPADKTELFNQALKEAAKEPKGEAVTSRKRATKSTEPAEEAPVAPPVEESPAAAAQAPSAESASEQPSAEATAADEAPAEETPAETDEKADGS